VERAMVDGPRRRLVSFRLEDPGTMPWGGELVLREGEPSGQVTSAAWSETLGAGVGLAYLWRQDGDTVTTDHVTTGHYELDVGGRLHVAHVGLRAPFDPTNERVR
jgi:glycine cleavage system aminomethyltransferase T